MHDENLFILYNIPTCIPEFAVIQYEYKENCLTSRSSMVSKASNPKNADNVKARVLHVMNVNHTKDG